MKKGFTLIELLAIIIILGLIAVITVPKIQETIEESKKSAYKTSVHALEREADNFYLTKKSSLESFAGCEYNFTNNTNTCEGYEFKGKKPESGTININKNGEVGFALKFDDICYVKKYKLNTLIEVNNKEFECGKNAYNIPELVTTGDGLYESQTDPERLIYRGEKPNNYINLKEDGTNDTLYRIVSYEVDGTIKVVRDEKLSSTIAWDTKNIRIGDSNTYCSNTASYGCNVWGSGTNTLYKGISLGDSFYYSYYNNASTTTLTNGESGKVGAESTLNIYLNSKTNNSTTSWQPAIKLDNYIDNHKFNVGGIYYTQVYEGGDKGLLKEKEEESLLTWTGKIGLLNITEYVEASTNPECSSVYSNYKFNYPKYYYQAEGESGKNQHAPTGNAYPCKNGNWIMYNKAYNQWTISPNSNGKFSVWNVYQEGYFSNSLAYDVHAVRPAFYLKSSIRLSGLGTPESPYELV